MFDDITSELPLPAAAGSCRPNEMRPVGRDQRLAGLTHLSALPIEATLVRDLSGTLHGMFDHVSDTTLPIYFGPLLGRLYLEGL